MAVLDLRSEIIRLLKEDKEFRHLVAGLLGYQEILEELKKLREDFHTFMKKQEERWEENSKRWEKADERFCHHRGRNKKTPRGFPNLR